MDEVSYRVSEGSRNASIWVMAISGLAASGPGVSVVKVQGEIDLATVPKLLRAIGMAGSRMYGRPLVIVDLRGVGFIDITGTRSLIEEVRALGNSGGASPDLTRKRPGGASLRATGERADTGRPDTRVRPRSRNPRGLAGGVRPQTGGGRREAATGQTPTRSHYPCRSTSLVSI